MRPSLLFLLFLCFSAGATAGVPDLYLSSATTNATEQTVIFAAPDGSGDSFTGGQGFGGHTVDATITLTLVDAANDPIFNYPFEDLWLETSLGGLYACPGGAVADANTDQFGQTTWVNPLCAGGNTDPASGEVTRVMVAGAPLVGSDLDIQFQSGDFDRDLDVDLDDVLLFAIEFCSGDNGFAADFYWDGVINLSDIAHMAGAVGARYGTGGLPTADDATIGMYFDPSGTDTCQPDTTGLVTAYLILTDVDQTVVQGFELDFSWTGDAILAGQAINGPTHLNLSPSTDLQVGYCSPFPVTDTAITLVTWQFFVVTGQVSEFFIAPYDPSSVPLNPTPVYLGDIADSFREMHPSSGAYDQPVAVIGGECPEPPGFEITSLDDVGNDQGGQLRITWHRCEHDAPGSETTITGYEIYRRQDGDRLDGWDYLQTVPAHGDSLYLSIAPTLCDSTAENGVCWSTFFLRAATPDPLVYFECPPDSGYSLDNLAPAAPANLAITSGITLSWSAVDDIDLGHYSVYAADTEDLADPVLIGHTTSASHDVTGTLGRYLAVTATDFAGNEGEVSPVIYNDPALDTPAVRRATLHQNQPNPFNPRTVIAFELPRSTRLTLTIYDVTGRVVRRLHDGLQAPGGRHECAWDGLDDHGLPLAGGVYLYRLQAGDFCETRRMTMIR